MAETEERDDREQLLDTLYLQERIASDEASGRSSRTRRRGGSAFCHHPPFNPGPTHHNTDRMQQLLPLFSRAGVRVVFSGHEHNFQHAG